MSSSTTNQPNLAPDGQPRAKPGELDPVSGNTAETIFLGGGEMGQRMRSFDWLRTPLGPVSSWPQSLKTAVRIILTSRYAMFIWWGRELINLYNDPYRAFLGSKHPTALGRSAREVWSEIWEQIGPRTEAVLVEGESTYDEGLLLLMQRHGYPEETYFTFSYSPLPDDSGRTGGLFCAVTEVTRQVIGERRLRLLREIAASMANCRTPELVCEAAADCLLSARRDLPFSLIYTLEADGTMLRKAGAAGIAGDHPAAPQLVRLDVAGDSIWPLGQVMTTGEPVLIEDLADRALPRPRGEWDRVPNCAVLLPLGQQGQAQPAGVLVAGLNPYRKYDEDFRGFLSVLSNQIAAAIANATSYEAERKRAETLAELDRTKTLFFSNVSHEFRTPLTLMLGPLEQVLGEARSKLTQASVDQIETARRNARRLLRMVNTLLDFSRIEAGRFQASYQPTDLSRFTEHIASAFRSTMESAGLKFSVVCEPLDDFVYVDREMWEKIVLNLLSNAFKYTFAGEVALTLRAVEGTIELSVRDTGVGIPEAELPTVFKRFHRVESTRGRTFEGTGIGLSLVQELVQLHGGTVRLESALGQGSTFTVGIPRGKAHLPAERVDMPQEPVAEGVDAWAYLDEIKRWLPQDTGVVEDEPAFPLAAPASFDSAEPGAQKPLILVADDNADMREYLVHLLREQYRTLAVGDGLQAVQACRRLHPALVLADVMMPELDGIGLVRDLRNDPALRGTPIILLSARAGEEAKVEGLKTGADDYLVKPFTARELLARIGSHLAMSRMRAEQNIKDAKFRALVQASSNVLYRMSPDWSQVLQLDGLGFLANAEQPISNWMEIYIPPEERPRVGEAIRQAIATKSPFQLEHRVRRADGTWGWTLSRAVPLLDDAGQITEWLGAASDITQRKRAEEGLYRLAAIVESSEDAIISKDLNGIVSTWNQAAEKMFGFTAEEMIGKPIRTIIPPELQQQEDHILRTIAGGGRIEHFDTVRLTKGGARIEVSLTISPVRDESGRVVGAAKIARDITQQRKAERALRTAERLASVGRLAATLAHEINNPLEAVTNLIYLSRSFAVREEVKQYLASAEEELKRVSYLTRQTLGSCRDQQAATPMTIGSVLPSVFQIYGTRMQSRGIEMEVDVRQDPEILASPLEIRQIVSNLLSNSIDAIDGKGKIRIRVSAAHEWSGEYRPGVRLTIADTGPGIPPAVRARLFEAFVTSKQDVGTGLGLWICKEIVEKYGGSIRARSAGASSVRWTSFSVFLPQHSQQEQESVFLKQAV